MGILAGAGHNDAPQIFLTPGLGSHVQVAGIGISLGNHDWLLFSPDEAAPTALPGARRAALALAGHRRDTAAVAAQPFT